jgi:hypothetical protein
MSIGKIGYKTESSSFFRNSYSNVRSPAPRKEATAIDYRSDGSGRDSYIIHNSGGLKNDYRQSGEKTFRDTLR